ncbi:hypothetical protein PIL02S_03436 [Paenibacillus illinoisensis]|uniref:Uncharacterized protein n=2 Tax=Paenibacillus illinoisensis TaxID=59845 RepID=A0A2W0CIY9_9BACL|nr:hypothetical protein PIL02S_03436 [Paenibacillus illinoisensis]
MLAFGFFKVSLKDYWKEILVTNVIISIGTFLVHTNTTLSSFIPLMCFVLLVASLTFYFRISIWSSIKLAFYGFVSQIVAQLVVTGMFMFSFEKTYRGALDEFGFYVQLVGDLFLIASTLILRKRKMWFTTMPYDYTYKMKLNRINLFSLALAVVMVVSLYNFEVSNILVAIIFWTICFLNLLFIDIKKERSGEA